MAAELEEAARTDCQADEEVRLIEQFAIALNRRGLLEGVAWTEWNRTRREIQEAFVQESHPQPLAQIQSTGEVDVLLRNIALCLSVHEQHQNSPMRVHIVLSALAQMEALLTDHVRDQLFEGVKARQGKADESLRRFLGLKWAPGTRFSLTEVRNAWAHGRALLVEDGLILHDRETFVEIGRVTVADLERLLRVGQAAWTAFQFDLVFQAAVEVRDHGRLNTYPVGPTESYRRLPQALAEDMQDP